MDIRADSPDTYTAIRKLHLTAFPGSGEANLVDQLRRDGDAVISLVAATDDGIVGHIMFSRMCAPFRALGLGPVAVLPSWSRKGIAASLIRAGVCQARKGGWQGIFVLGEPDYYQRFGFSVALAENFLSRYAGPYLMALALEDNALPERLGLIDYAPAFSRL